MGVLRLLYPLTEVDLPLFVDDFHPKIEVALNQKTFNSILVLHHIFFPVVLRIWCMNFYETTLFQMIL
jgi:hypothetical protein